MTDATSTAYVYCLVHAHEPRFKLGKANNVLARARVLGMKGLDLARSFALQVPSARRAYQVEDGLHKLLDLYRISPQQLERSGDMPAQGFTEWFRAEALADLRKLLENHAKLFAGTVIDGRELTRQVSTPAKLAPALEVRSLTNEQRVASERTWASFCDAIERGRQDWPAAIEECRALVEQMRQRAQFFAHEDGRLYIACSSAETFQPICELGQRLSAQSARLCVRSRNHRFSTIYFSAASRLVVNAKRYWLTQAIDLVAPMVEVGRSLTMLEDSNPAMYEVLRPIVKQLFEQWVAPFAPPIEGWDDDLSEQACARIDEMNANWQDREIRPAA